MAVSIEGGHLKEARYACNVKNPIFSTPTAHNLDVSFKIAKWNSNIKNCGDKCFFCHGRFKTHQYVAFIPQHPNDYAHIECFNMWFTNLNKRVKEALPQCPLCNSKSFMTCVECGKVMSTTETIFNFHNHPGYHICVRCVAFNTNATYDPDNNDVTGYYHATAACVWCEKNKYGGALTVVNLSDVTSKEIWPLIRCFKQIQIMMLSFSHQLAHINCHTSAVRLRDSYANFFG